MKWYRATVLVLWVVLVVLWVITLRTPAGRTPVQPHPSAVERTAAPDRPVTVRVPVDR